MKRWRRPKADHVTPLIALAVLQRDQGCIPARLGAPGECQGRLEIMHIRDAAGTKRPKPDMRHLAAGCGWHHGTIRVGGGWATSHDGLERLRDYLRAQRDGIPA